MKQNRFALFGTLTASALLIATAPAVAEDNAGVTLGYPGGYGIAQPSYVAPQPFNVQPPPATMQRDWNDGRSQWRERQDQHEREWEYRRRHEETHRNDNRVWGQSPLQDNRGWRDGWQR